MTHNKAMAKAVAFSQILSITLLPPPAPSTPPAMHGNHQINS